eukprot:scaffold97354_cov63-Phaeocystis_antarctica.AAC.2
MVYTAAKAGYTYYGGTPQPRRAPTCNPMRPVLQPYVPRPATLCTPACNPMCAVPGGRDRSEQD